MGEATRKKRLVVGISGASGVMLAIELLKQMQTNPEWETHLVLTTSACKTIPIETEYRKEEVESMATIVHPLNDVGASISSGTFKTEGMVIVPCSMKTLAGVASGYSENLLLRAADVTLKERRPLVLVARESPLNRIHIRNMLSASDAGAIILPPVVPYYHSPTSVREITMHIVGKILDIFDIQVPEFRRWGSRPEGLNSPAC